MATVHLRKVPDDLYEDLRALARSQQCSLNSLVIRMLQKAMDEEKRRTRQRQLLAEIREQRFTYREKTPDSVELLREDRGR